VTPLQVAQKFVERIDAADVAGLATLMTEDHRFIDSLGNEVSGREAMKAGWVGYFSMVPDYRLTAQQWLCDGPVAVMLGTASGTYSPDGSGRRRLPWTPTGGPGTPDFRGQENFQSCLHGHRNSGSATAAFCGRLEIGVVLRGEGDSPCAPGGSRCRLPAPCLVRGCLVRRLSGARLSLARRRRRSESVRWGKIPGGNEK
jgi:hypothetical protein